MDNLELIDRSLFFLINGHHSPFFDQLMELVSMRLIWIPAYVFLAWALYRFYGVNGLLIGLVSAGILIALTDAGSNYLFKHNVQRYRPCHNTEIAHLVHLVNNHCGGMYGFISSHAANFFGLATFFSFLLKSHWRKSPFLFFFAAILVSYSRIYLGVHYPSDIAVAAIWGILWGWISYLLFQNLYSKKIN
ncbi:MAG TPA: phosphatase PAP2 family protein [Flavobacteriales bacterium]|nr:phosphatase PAP2 family protein [Flavobacteriales bacterium]HCA82650.1 phosphatase PAP2 family protein [Flavobacteriales bacterium]HRE73969.1 phosphatase PAP2 family protein [Flavobacteriales bacterium]HRE96631.1 phosphatase PAP2 family protein [Flavobacteriales bacterium]HRJ35798.1 phosphatase PAP2 family protein [Flavobacteriales bacterium]